MTSEVVSSLLKSYGYYDSFGETGAENQANFAWGTVKLRVLLVQSAWSNTLT
jgi:hypothetical protein